MKIDGKNFSFGLGSGIIFICLVFYLLYSFSFKPTLKNYVNASEIVVSDAEIESRAKDMGMVYAKELPEKSFENEAASTAVEGVPLPPTSPIAFEQIETNQIMYAKVAIPEGSSASEISTILQQNGIIDDADKFEDFLKDNNATKRFRSGTFEYPLNATYEQVFEIGVK